MMMMMMMMMLMFVLATSKKQYEDAHVWWYHFEEKDVHFCHAYVDGIVACAALSHATCPNSRG